MKKKGLALLLTLVMVLVCLAGCGESGTTEENSEVVAKIGETELTMDDLETYAAITSMMYYGTDYSTLDGNYQSYIKQMMLSGLVDSKLAIAYCEEQKIDLTKRDGYKTDLKSFLDGTKSNETYAAIVKNCKLSEEDLEAFYKGVSAGNVIFEEVEGGIADLDAKIAEYYEAHKADLYTYTEPESTVSHILVKDEATGNEVLKKLKEGGDFAELAKEYSKDGSASNGGLLGTYTASNCNWVEEFKDAAFKLKAGETSGLVKSEFGYHIIRVTERTEAGTVKTLESVKDSVKQELIYQAYTEKMQKLEKQFKVEYLLEIEAPKIGSEESDTTENDASDAAEE